MELLLRSKQALTAVSLLEDLVQREDVKPSIYQFNYYLTKLRGHYAQDMTALTRLRRILNTRKLGLSSRYDRERLVLAEIKLLQDLFGSSHPELHSLLESVLSPGQSRPSCSIVDFVYEHFLKHDEFERGYEYFLSLFEESEDCEDLGTGSAQSA